MLFDDELNLISENDNRGSLNVDDVLLNSSNKAKNHSKASMKTKYLFLVSVMVMRSMETLMVSMTIL